MKVFVQAKAMAKHPQIQTMAENHLRVAVKEPPLRGKANQAIARALAEYYHVSPSQVQLVSGFASKQKVFQILN